MCPAIEFNHLGWKNLTTTVQPWLRSMSCRRLSSACGLERHPGRGNVLLVGHIQLVVFPQGFRPLSLHFVGRAH